MNYKPVKRRKKIVLFVNARHQKITEAYKFLPEHWTEKEKVYFVKYYEKFVLKAVSRPLILGAMLYIFEKYRFLNDFFAGDILYRAGNLKEEEIIKRIEGRIKARQEQIRQIRAIEDGQNK